MELTERLGGSIDYWSTEPWEHALWAYRHLRELDYRRGWLSRMARIETAELQHIALTAPERLGGERQKAIADAAPRSMDDIALERGRRMADEIRRGQVLLS